MNNVEPIATVHKRPLHVLFVEDNPADVELGLRELRKAALDVRADVVQTTQEFSQRLHSNPYDIILADYQLTGWTGMDALELLRKQGKDTPFILLTGMLGDEKVVECIKKGVSDYILKDRLARLPIAVCRALEEKHLRDDRGRAETMLRESEAKFRTLAETVASAILIYQGTQCRYANRAAELISGYTREELLAMSSWDLFHPDSREVVIEKGFARQPGDHSPIRYEVKILTKDGQARWLDVTASITDFESRPAGLMTAFDITERKQMEEETRHLGASDPLTGLANYRRLVDVFNLEVQRSRRTGRSFALVLLDLDGLKKINDSWGYLVGSRAICRVGHILRVHCRAVDTAARHGDDEFALVLPETGADAARQAARRIAQRVANDGEQPPLSVSFGVAAFSEDGETIDDLLRIADSGLYMMKGGQGGKLPVPA